ncbi:N-formylglutamate amidohydrolase [Paracoccus aerodenitrificans]|uniref:N-formylglutamate amidohydrolase n=1 Tax=Paracoccus aerodenitrificans TaxID=3017781 RepID=UPI0022EFE9FD|nr:N-formylglutamate amidohydrolase [Paracoccus aerodenitrificans]WBU63610.1 N-formylglutamate amidohydrolase [Paracoccus aerodenitrificans]
MMDSHGYILRQPQVWESGVIFCSPHSGREFPDWFLQESRLDVAALRSSEDAFIDRLIEPVLDAGAVTLASRVPRSIVDLNRGTSELDPEAVQCGPHRPTTPRAHAGLGVIPRVVSGARPIRNAPIPMAEAKRRIDTYWRPYHAALRELVEQAMSRFGWAIIIDMHSMPHEAVSHMVPPLPEVVIGDRHGVSCGAQLRENVGHLFRQADFRLRFNAPFSGAYVANAYGRPSQGVHVLQVEIDRALYLDETRTEPSRQFDAFAARLGHVLTRIARLRPDQSIVKVAAE